MYIYKITFKLKKYSCIKQEATCLTKYPNTKERVESTEYNRVFVTNFNVLRNLVKYCLPEIRYPNNETVVQQNRGEGRS